MDKNRLARIEGEMKREISSIIAYEINDPKVSSFASISKVDVTNDLQHAKIYISVLGAGNVKRDTMEGLERASGFIKKELSSRLRLRVMPKLKFILDESIEKGVYMNKLIEDVIAQDEENQRKREENEFD